MRQLIYISTILLTFQSCRHQVKYEMMNMTPEPIDVTNYIESGEFLPDSCEGRLDRLIKVKPLTLDQSYEIELQNKLDKWKDDYNNWLRKNSRDTIAFHISDLYKKTTYQYSYMLMADPIDIYRTNTEIEINGQNNFMFFIGVDKNGKIFSEYKEDGWVLNNCDSVNSIIPDIYGQK